MVRGIFRLYYQHGLRSQEENKISHNEQPQNSDEIIMETWNERE